MTGFGDVNVGDKVRLKDRQKPSTRHEIIVTQRDRDGGGYQRVMDGVVSYYEARWSVEVLEKAPDSPLVYWRRRLAELEALPEPTFADRLNMNTARVIVGDLESRNLGGKS